MRGRWGLVALTQVAKIAYVRRGTGYRRTSGERRSAEVFVSGATELTTTRAADLAAMTSETLCSASVLQPLANVNFFVGGLLTLRASCALQDPGRNSWALRSLH